MMFHAEEEKGPIMKKHGILTRVVAVAVAVVVAGALSCLVSKPAYAIQRILEVNVRIEQPRAGHKPDTSGSMSSTPSRGVRMSGVSWNPGDETFQMGKQYTASFTLKVDRDYMFVENVAVKVNGKTAKWRNYGSGTIMVEYTFDKVPGIPDDDE